MAKQFETRVGTLDAGFVKSLVDVPACYVSFLDTVYRIPVEDFCEWVLFVCEKVLKHCDNEGHHQPVKELARKLVLLVAEAEGQ